MFRQMEKIIELLNEYRTEKLRRKMYVNWADKKATELSEAERINEYEVSQTLDSLNYLRLFIKWLVENDKIDLDRIPAIEDNGATNIVLMLLSIQDEPIEFLISILKNV
jgi:hypothetical protein